MKINTPPFDRFNDTLKSATHPRDLFGENPPRSHVEIVNLLKALRALKEKTGPMDIMTHMAFDKLEIFLEWSRHLLIFARWGKKNPKPELEQEYRLKLEILVQVFKGKKMFRLDHYSKTVFFSKISAEVLEGLWWNDKYELIRAGKVFHSGNVRYLGTRNDCNVFNDSRRESGDYRFGFSPEEFEVGDEIHIFTVKHQSAWCFLSAV